MDILAVIGLCSLIFILIYICFRIFIAIISTFVYLTGLATILLFIIFGLFLILNFARRLFRRYKCYKRCNLSSKEILRLTSEFQVRVICELSILAIFLYIVRFIIYIV